MSNPNISELQWVVEFPVPCGNCGKETIYMVHHIVDRDSIVCPLCQAALMLDSPEWIAVRKVLRELCVGKKAPIAKVYKP